MEVYKIQFNFRDYDTYVIYVPSFENIFSSEFALAFLKLRLRNVRKLKFSVLVLLVVFIAEEHYASGRIIFCSASS